MKLGSGQKMSKWYGSVNNRCEEGHKYCKTIEVGTGMTEYLWSDRHPYEVTRVISQEHVFVRPMDHERIDKNGMSECQEYKYISNPSYNEIELKKYRGNWCIVHSFNKEKILNEVEEFFKSDKNFCRTKEKEFEFRISKANFTPKQRQDFENGKTICKYHMWKNISFGVMEYYYDFSF